MGLMTLNLATLNLRGLRDSSKCTCLLAELKNLRINVTAETRFLCAADYRVLENDFNVFSAYGSRSSAGVSLLVGLSLDADVFAGDGAGTGCGRCCHKKFQVPTVFGLCAQYHCREGFVFSSVGTIPGRHEASSLNG